MLEVEPRHIPCRALQHPERPGIPWALGIVGGRQVVLQDVRIQARQCAGVFGRTGVIELQKDTAIKGKAARCGVRDPEGSQIASQLSERGTVDGCVDRHGGRAGGKEVVVEGNYSFRLGTNPLYLRFGDAGEFEFDPEISLAVAGRPRWWRCRG